ncbi:hypothetical protein [Legionella antarctica]|nr:hypothetical protein [Legionella antarctica]
MTLEQLEAWEQKIVSLIEIIRANPQLASYVDKAHHLSKDYSNDSEINNAVFEACSGYSVSMQIYAELNRGLLSSQEYAALQHAINILGRGVEQGLKTDANFMHYLVRTLGIRNKVYINSAASYMGTIEASPEQRASILWNTQNCINPIKSRLVYPQLEEKINENIDNLLHGNPNVEWWGGAKGKPPYKMRRFLPDANMMSETNEITLQGGRMINHSAMFRIIKVGNTATGGITTDPNKIHHFEYYHVQTNLGAECNELNGDVCSGTYITKLAPIKLENDDITPLFIIPEVDPKGYQQAMETTIRELIKTERQMSFYRKPQQGPNGEGSSPAGSPEALEWTRLNNHLTLLKGNPIGQDHELNYFSIGLDGKSVRSVMKNQKNYTQRGGSCTIFSIKQLVTSILEMHATSLHSNFLQHNDGKKQVASLYELHEEIKKQKLHIQRKPKSIVDPQPVIIDDTVVVPKQESYEEYYSKQMQFFDRFIRKICHSNDDARLQRITHLQKQQRIFFLDEFLNVEQGKELETTRIGYQPLDYVAYKSDQLTLAPDGGAINEKNRRLSRYRLVYGPVDFYLSNQLNKPTEIPVITACAPNLMGTSQVDLDEFSEAGILKADQYGNECRKLADFIVSQAKANGNQRLIMPTFGVGVYIDQLNPYYGSQETAQRIMYGVFAEAAKKHEVNVDWVVWNDLGNPDGSITTTQRYQSYVPGNKYMNAVLHTDMISYGQEQQQKGEKVVLLNPGSDRTIGGAYTHRNPKTLEEQIAQKSDLILLHSELNQSMTHVFDTEFQQRKIGYTPKQEIPKLKTAGELKTEEMLNKTFKFIDWNTIKTQLGVEEHPVILQKNNHFCIGFYNKNNAMQFSAFLANNNITDVNGKLKFVQRNKSCYVVYLTQEEWNKLPQLGHKKEEELKKAEGQTILFKTASEYIKDQVPLCSESPFIKVTSDGKYKISFKKSDNADRFSTFLASPEINIVRQSGDRKEILSDGSYYAVYLTPDQWKRFSSLPQKPEDLRKQEEQRKLHEEQEKQVKLEEQRRSKAQEQFKTVAVEINQQLNLGSEESPSITQATSGDYKISFTKEESAWEFSRFLARLNVFGSKGNPKWVNANGMYHVVILTQDQWLKLPTLMKQEATNQQEEQRKLHEEQEKQRKFQEEQEKQVKLEEQRRSKAQEQFKTVAVEINQQLNLDSEESPSITQATSGDYKISFTKEESARKFSKFLARLQVFGSKGNPKWVNADGMYHVVILTQDQWLKLPMLMKQEATNQQEEQRKLHEEQEKQRKFQEEQEKQVKLEEQRKLHEEQEKQVKLEQLKQVELLGTIETIDNVLQQLKSKIGEVDRHQFSESKDIALNLLDNLNNARNQYAATLQSGKVDINTIRNTFNEACERAIIDAKPILERDLAWGDYLVNLLKTLANAVIWTVTLGNVNSFFIKVKPASLEAVEDLEQDLNLPKRL